jgi:hypothetical protein
MAELEIRRLDDGHDRAAFDGGQPMLNLFLPMQEIRKLKSISLSRQSHLPTRSRRATTRIPDQDGAGWGRAETRTLCGRANWAESATS